MSGSDFLDFDCLAYATRRTGRAVTNLFNSRLTHLDLNVAQFGLLAAVAKLPGSTLAAIGVGIGLLIGGGAALIALPIVGESVGVQTTTGVSILEEVQLEGKERTDIKAFVNGYKNFIGSSLQ